LGRKKRTAKLVSTAPKIGIVQDSQTSRLFERHFSPADLAETWSLSQDTVRRMFENEPGVLIFENSERSSSRRRRTLRIPESVAERVYCRYSSRAGGERFRPKT
jgi:hypothetical protein